jgi:translation initiation factor IF-3
VPIQPKRTRVNERITARLIRVIGENGDQLGIMSPAEALDVAYDHGLDLVEVAPEADPPVCRIMDWGKFQYDQAKKTREASRSHITIQIKEIRLRPKIEEHDFMFKSRHAKRFLDEHNKVKVLVLFKGRELIHQEIGLRLLERFAAELADFCVVETPPKIEGRIMHMILVPKTVKKADEKETTTREDEQPDVDISQSNGDINA